MLTIAKAIGFIAKEQNKVVNGWEITKRNLIKGRETLAKQT